ncbi:hypothetical protein CGCF415_v002496 [Colletotrichum fructicola]|uniref:Uncharacterized protein n=1 Tax=Colletotrichum fructicola (strain Nara gc5) TaxID=1213859 RepID=A0A7J6J8J6_COLFN|nr:hypothetical protein CGGC5_v005223 [Colletotrichum fructicola Nara gc5]KAF4894398.1 hypothetical protein CGCFRS4_v006601 [Colletotrichum fructicola]KAF4914097.1 hypothetical protein CGCF415_v002496 [Colletotrichum fructicola]KAF4937619.1 hypothetical protein CGCF245_v005336 [Colletotrichum fructicola]
MDLEATVSWHLKPRLRDRGYVFLQSTALRSPSYSGETNVSPPNRLRPIDEIHYKIHHDYLHSKTARARHNPEPMAKRLMKYIWLQWQAVQHLRARSSLSFAYSSLFDI